MVFDYARLGTRVRFYRKKRGMSQSALAEAVDRATTYISYIEHGHKSMSLETFVSIANALHVSADELLMDSLENTVRVSNSEFSDMMSDCTDFERRVLFDVLKATKESIRDNRPYFRRQ